MPNNKVLIVDNEDAIIESTAMLLKVLGYTAVGVRSADETLRSARGERPFLILQDVRMPNLDLKRAIRELRMDPATAHIPIVLFSAAPFLDATMSELGADAYLPKPFNPSDLENVLRRFSAKVPAQPEVLRG